MPVDVWSSATMPIGVRLEFVGDARAVRVHYRTTTGNLGYRGEGAGCTFTAYRAGQKIAEAPAMLGEGAVELPLSGVPERPVTIFLPEGMRPVVLALECGSGTIEPAPPQPRWLCYGDAVTQGWLASSPAQSWPAVVARKVGLDLCNLGYAGAVRADTMAALMLADIPAELISLSFGASCWGRVPHTPGLLSEAVRAFIKLLRTGHPTTPIVLISPIVRPDAEATPNRLGATLHELRVAMEEAVRECVAAGDANLLLVEGAGIVTPDQLTDHIFPGDEGHVRIAAAFGKVTGGITGDLRFALEARLAAQNAPPVDEFASLPSTEFLNHVPQRPLPPVPMSPVAQAESQSASGDAMVQGTQEV